MADPELALASSRPVQDPEERVADLMDSIRGWLVAITASDSFTTEAEWKVELWARVFANPINFAQCCGHWKVECVCTQLIKAVENSPPLSAVSLKMPNAVFGVGAEALPNEVRGASQKPDALLAIKLNHNADPRVDFRHPAASVAFGPQPIVSKLPIEGKPPGGNDGYAMRQASMSGTSCCYHQIALGAEKPWSVFGAITGTELRFYAMEGTKQNDGTWQLTYRPIEDCSLSLKSLGDCMAVYALGRSLMASAESDRLGFERLFTTAVTAERQPPKWWLDSTRSESNTDTVAGSSDVPSGAVGTGRKRSDMSGRPTQGQGSKGTRQGGSGGGGGGGGATAEKRRKVAMGASTYVGSEGSSEEKRQAVLEWLGNMAEPDTGVKPASEVGVTAESTTPSVWSWFGLRR